MSAVQFSSSAYIHLQTLKNGHSDTVNTLSFSSNGVYLASGGDDQAVVIRNALKGQMLYRILFDNAVDCVLWHPKHAETLVVGLAGGFLLQMHGFSLHNYRKHDIHLGARSTVYCLDYDPRTECLAIGMGEEVHLTREVERNSYHGDVVLPPPAPSQEPPSEGADTRVRAIAVKFHKDGTQIIVSYVGHGIICWNVSGSAPEQVWRIVMPKMYPNIGGTAVSPDARRIAVYNLVDGLHLYAVGGSAKQKPRKHYKFDKPPRSKLLLQVRFIHGGRALLCGTTTGNVLLWEVDSGEVLQELSHGDDIIQAISAIQYSNNSYIATGTAAKGQETYIKIWRAKISAPVDSGDREFQDTVADLVQAVAGNRLPVARERLKDLISLLLGLLTCALLAWLCTLVSWPEVWACTVILVSDIAAISQRIAHAVSVHGAVALNNARSTVSKAAAHCADVIRNATLAFLFPDRREGAPHGRHEL